MGRLLASLKIGGLVVGIIGLLGCPPDLTIRIRPGSNIQSAVFVIDGPPVELIYVSVQTCHSTFSGGRAFLWTLDHGPHPSRLDSLTYGQVPPGYREMVHAVPLLPNRCYVASYGGPNALYFIVDPAGMIHEISRDEAANRAAAPTQ